MGDMALPCPLDVCDGSGVVSDDIDGIGMCPHLDTEDYDPNDDL